MIYFYRRTAINISPVKSPRERPNILRSPAAKLKQIPESPSKVYQIDMKDGVGVLIDLDKGRSK